MLGRILSRLASGLPVHDSQWIWLGLPFLVNVIYPDIANHAHLAPTYEQTSEDDSLSSANLPKELSEAKD